MTDEQKELPDRVDILQAAHELGVHPSTVHRLIDKQTILASLTGGRWTIDRTWFDQFKANYDPRPGPGRRKPTLF